MSHFLTHQEVNDIQKILFSCRNKAITEPSLKQRIAITLKDLQGMRMVFMNIINSGDGGLDAMSHPTLCNPVDCNCQAPLSMVFSRQSYGMGCHLLLQGIFLTQGPNPGLLHCRQILYQATRETHNKYCCCCCSVPQSCLTLCDLLDYSTPGFPVLHQFPGLAQTHAHWDNDAIQSSCPLPSPSPPAFNLS